MEGGREGYVCAFRHRPLGDRHGVRGRPWTGREGGGEGGREGGMKGGKEGGRKGGREGVCVCIL